MNEDFDLDFYLQTYPDIVENGLTTYTKAYNHYINYGKKEGRICNNSNMKNNYGYGYSSSKKERLKSYSNR